MARLLDGSGTQISLANGTTLWEVGINLPTMEGGGGVETTTLRNTTMRTRKPKTLKNLSEASFSAQYDDAHAATIYSAINTNQEITITWPDASTLKFWGWVDSVSFGEIVQGEAPTVDITIVCSNQDSETEKAPAFA